MRSSRLPSRMQLRRSSRSRKPAPPGFDSIGSRRRLDRPPNAATRSEPQFFGRGSRIGLEAKPTRPSAPRPAPPCARWRCDCEKQLFVQKGEASRWVEALLPLLKRAAAEFWSAERRLLYDLQLVCVDHEREIFRLEPIGWLLSLGRHPLKHPLPHLREVVMSKHLRSAAKWLRRVRVGARTGFGSRGCSGRPCAGLRKP